MPVAIFHGDKGGCGKSTCAASYAEYLTAQGREFIAIDCDPRNGDVSRYVSSFAKQVERIDLRGDADDASAGWSEVYQVLGESQIADVIISMPAGIGSVVTDRAAELVGAIEDTGRDVEYYWVLDSSSDSIALLAAFASVVGWPKIVVLRNRHFGSDARFKMWIASKTREKLIAGGGREVDFPKLGDALMGLTFRSNPPLRFVEKESLHYGQRWMLRSWMTSAFAAFA